MPAFEVRDRKQKAVLWAAASVDNHGNTTVSDDPVELEVRWVPTQKTATDAKGNPIAVDAVVIVDRAIDIDSILWLGAMDDIPGTSFSPTTDLLEVVTYNETPDIKNRHVRREVGVRRYNDTALPTG